MVHIPSALNWFSSANDVVTLYAPSDKIEIRFSQGDKLLVSPKKAIPEGPTGTTTK